MTEAVLSLDELRAASLKSGDQIDVIGSDEIPV